MRYFIFSLLLFSCLMLPAQQNFAPGNQGSIIAPCAQHQLTHKLQSEHPDAQSKTKPIPNYKNCDTTNRIIPVVFHLIHLCGAEKIDKAQIDSALIDVNHCYNKTNWDLSYVLPSDPHFNKISDVGLTFQLATLDPYGNATTGITETESKFTYSAAFNDGTMKNIIFWDRSRYLNVWVVNSTGASSPAYAYYPSSVDNPVFDFYDGIVNAHNVLGTTGTAVDNYGPNILSHEIGHWLSLKHTWGDQYGFGEPDACNDDDDVTDTPNTTGNTPTDCPTPINDSCPGDGPDNQYNMMDYGCEVMFTEGQKSRIYDCLCSNLSRRDEIGTSLSNQTTFLTNPGPRMLVKQYVFNESSENDGTIETEIEISLTTGSFVTNMIGGQHFTVTGLPPGLSPVAQGVGNVVRVQLVGTATNHAVADNVDSISIEFLPPAFSGVSPSNLHKTTVDGLSIQYRSPGRLIHNSHLYTTGASQCISPVDGQYTFWTHLDGTSMGVVYYQPNFNLYNNGRPIDILCVQGTTNVGKFQYGQSIQATMSGYEYKPILTGNPNEPNEIVLWSPTYTAFENQLSYAIFRFRQTCGGAYGYGWMSFYVDPGANSVCIVDMVYHQDTNVPVTTGVGNCVPSGDSQNQWIERVDLNNLTNTTGNDGGYASYTNLSATVDPANGANFILHKGGFTSNQAYWKIWVDFNGNGSFNDPGERVYDQFENSNGATVSETNYPLVPQGTTPGTYIMRVGISFYEYYNPCQYLDYAEFEDYAIQVGSGSTCATPPPSSITHNYAGVATLYLLAYPYSGVSHQFRYREVGAANWITLQPTTSHYDVANPVSLCTDYEAQLRVDCSGQWSNYSASHPFNVSDNSSSIQLLLEGPYNSSTGMMETSLYNDGLLPGMTPVNGGTPTTAGQPYSQSPWNYQGTEGQAFSDQDYSSIEINTTQKPVDWVLISFRTGISSSTEVEKTAALLLEDGTVHFVDGCLNLTPNQNYHIVVEHRNHLAVMTVGLVNYLNGVFTLQFTNQASYGGGSKQLSGGDWVLFSSDANADGTISAADRSAVWNARNTTGYLMADSDMNGVCNASDRSQTWNNRNAFSLVP